MDTLHESLGSILKGAGVGAVVGGSMAVANHFIAAQRAAPLVLDFPGAPPMSLNALRSHRSLARLVSLFTPFAVVNEAAKHMYVTMVTNCNRLVDAERRKVKGAEQLQASRAALQAITSARALCREAAKAIQSGGSCEADPFEAMREIEQLEVQTNNLLHNIMLG